ncbi:MAG: hypothetical protein HRT89_18965, partial [Lentisphaeria bacterium]|nr:hypothetical protein [Lentisphaeria bacterium]
EIEKLKLEEIYQKFEDDNEISKRRTALNKLAKKQEEIFKTRLDWLKRLESSMKVASQYHNRFANTGKKFAWKKTKFNYKAIYMHTIKNTKTDKVRISSITEKDIIFEVLSYNSDAELVPKQPRSKEIYSIYDFALFRNPKTGSSLIEQLIHYDRYENNAKEAKDLANEKLCYDYYLGLIPKAEAALKEGTIKTAEASFIKEEIDEYREDWVVQFVDRMYKRSKKSKFRTMRRWYYYNVLKKLVGKEDYFIEREDDFRRLYGRR